MDSKWKIKRLDEIAYNATSRFEVKNKVEAIFINTGDVYKGQFLHHDFSSIFEMPGQAKKAISNDDILYSEIRPGNKRYCYVNLSNPEDYVISTKFMIIRTKEDILPKYLYLILTSSYCENEFKLTAESRSGTFPQITFDSVGYYPIKYPDKHTQQKIVSFIKSLDQKITLNNQINETLEAMAQAIFKSWFIDFEPVKAKIEAKEAGQDVEGILLAAMSAISGKDSKALKTLQTTAPEEYAELKAIAEKFPDSLEESELGMIPKGWGVRSFGKLLQYSIGGDWGKESEDKNHTVEVKILRGTDLLDVHKGKTENVPVRYLNEKKYKTRKLQVGDIVIEISGGSKNQPTGRSLFITENILNNLGNEVAPTSFCRLFRAIDHHIGLLLALHLQIIYQNGKTWLYQNQSTGISNFQTKVFLENEKVIIPDREVLREFYKHIMIVFSKITTSENKVLTELRNTLLPKLLSGEIDVSNVEIM